MSCELMHEASMLPQTGKQSVSCAIWSVFIDKSVCGVSVYTLPHSFFHFEWEELGSLKYMWCSTHGEEGFYGEASTQGV